jgi:hypothetical protein
MKKNMNALYMLFMAAFLCTSSHVLAVGEDLEDPSVTAEAAEEDNSLTMPNMPSFKKRVAKEKEEADENDESKKPEKKDITALEDESDSGLSDSFKPSRFKPSERYSSAENDDAFVTDVIDQENKMQKDNSLENAAQAMKNLSKENSDSEAIPPLMQNNPMSPALPQVPMQMMMPQMPMQMPMMSPSPFMQMQHPLTMSSASIDPNMIFFYAYNATAKAIQDFLPNLMTQLQKTNKAPVTNQSLDL